MTDAFSTSCDINKTTGGYFYGKIKKNRIRPDELLDIYHFYQEGE